MLCHWPTFSNNFYPQSKEVYSFLLTGVQNTPNKSHSLPLQWEHLVPSGCLRLEHNVATAQQTAPVVHKAAWHAVHETAAPAVGDLRKWWLSRWGCYPAWTLCPPAPVPQGFRGSQESGSVDSSSWTVAQSLPTCETGIWILSCSMNSDMYLSFEVRSLCRYWLFLE